MQARYNANPKRNRDAVNQPTYARPRAAQSWPEARGIAPRLGGQFGRYVRNKAGKVVRLSTTPEAE